MHGPSSDWNETFWSNLLSIATRFCFDDIRKRAITHLSATLSPVEKIYHGKKYDIPDWLPEAYKSICKRREPITLDEAERIGWQTAVLLGNAREVYYRGSGGDDDDASNDGWPSRQGVYRSSTGWGVSVIAIDNTEDTRATQAVNKVFGVSATAPGERAVSATSRRRD